MNLLANYVVTTSGFAYLAQGVGEFLARRCADHFAAQTIIRANAAAGFGYFGAICVASSSFHPGALESLWADLPVVCIMPWGLPALSAARLYLAGPMEKYLGTSSKEFLVPLGLFYAASMTVCIAVAFASEQFHLARPLVLYIAPFLLGGALGSFWGLLQIFADLIQRGVDWLLAARDALHLKEAEDAEIAEYLADVGEHETTEAL